MTNTPSGALGRHLQSILLSSEHVLDFAGGNSGQWLVATNLRAIIVKRGATIFSGLQSYVFLYQHITNIDMRPGLSNYVEIATAGTPTKDKGMLERIYDKSTLNYGPLSAGGIKRVVGVIRNQIALAMAPQAATSQSIPEQLAQLAQLLQNKAITQQEYEQAKRKILGR